MVLNVGGIGFALLIPKRAAEKLPAEGKAAKIFTHLHVREDSLELYGFADGETRDLFNQLIAVGGVGPKSAISILDVADINELKSAIKEGRPDLLTKASGVGRKTAERIVLELRGKVEAQSARAVVSQMEGDVDLIDALFGLGYKKDRAKAALLKVDDSIKGLEERLKAALAILSSKK